MEEELKFHLSDETKDMFVEIFAMQHGQQRQAVTVLAGFISTNETDLDAFLRRHRIDKVK